MYIHVSDELIERGKQPGQVPLITKKLFIESWPSSENPFDCTELNDLRRKGIFKCEYSCQGESVEDESWALPILAPTRKSWAWTALSFWILTYLLI
jgi:hypothetical protein